MSPESLVAGTAEVENCVELLLMSRHERKVLHAGDLPWTGLTSMSARAIANRLYELGGRSRYFKLGAIDLAAQLPLGVSGPICVPMLTGASSTNVRSEVLRLSDLIDPKFEPEIGILPRPGGIRALLCVEIADSRFSDWELPPFGVEVELGLQGRMLFGIPVAPLTDLEVTVSHDGDIVAQGFAAWDGVVSRLVLLPSGLEVHLVATGSMTAMLPVRRSLWAFGFGALGGILVTVA